MAAHHSFRITKRTSSEGLNTKLQRPTQISTSTRCERSASALAQYQPHKLSEIPEVSASSKASFARRYSSKCLDGMQAVDKIDAVEEKNTNPGRPISRVGDFSLDPPCLSERDVTRPISPRSDLRSLAPSALSLPLHEIPKRRSSMTALSMSDPRSLQASLQDLRSETAESQNPIAKQRNTGSPVRHAVERGAQSSAALQTSSSCTFVRTATPYYLLDHDHGRNSRLDLSIRLSSPLFVGGGTAEGQIELKVDVNSNKKTRSKPLYISRLSVDIIGVEEVQDGRRRIFLSLATELFDIQRPPPLTLVRSQIPQKGSEIYWETKPATVIIPFCLNLPLKLGPPPYSSRQASIRYLICPSAVIKVGEKRSAVRQAWTIQMLTVHDPERALSSLPSPLLATDTLVLGTAPIMSSVKLTAGLHRQTWVSGEKVFTDLHVVNSTDKSIKRIEVQLEKSLLWFLHSAAGTVEKNAKNLRLPAKIETDVLCTNTIKKTKDWNGIRPGASEVRTCELDIPKGQVTIGDGRYFEVRYFLKTTVYISRSKAVSVQLPVTIIHFNSLDILPNSVARVAASIEAKRSMAVAAITDSIARLPHVQGQAFSAARHQPSRKSKPQAAILTADDIIALAQTLDSSPRRIGRLQDTEVDRIWDVEQGPAKENIRSEPTPCYRHPTLRSSCYHCHLLYTAHASRMSERHGPKLPRLQVSTSGLGFSETEFEVPPDTPRKVMLSENERQMIKQQRELRMQRQLSRPKRVSMSPGEQAAVMKTSSGWRNVAAQPEAELSGPIDPTQQNKRMPVQRLSQRTGGVARTQRKSLPSALPRRLCSRSRSERARASFSDGCPGESRISKPGRGIRSPERGDKYPWAGYNLVENDVFGPDMAERNELQ